MSTLSSIATPRPVPVKPAHGKASEVLTIVEHCEDHEILAIPNRGILLASLLSSALWVVLILAAREVWLYLR